MINYAIVIICLVFVSCASAPNNLRDVETIADVSESRSREILTCENAEEYLNRYSIDFKIPNPFVGDSVISSRRVDPSHEATIYCRATLLDEVSTEADIIIGCEKDSLDEASCEKFRKTYIEKNVREGMFRIRILMVSGFSPKSMDPDHWAIYIEDARGIMIEPKEIKTYEVSASQDTIYSKYYGIFLPRNLLRRDINLYFQRRTFFGEDLLGEENPHIVFVMSHEKKTVARVAWNIHEKKR